MEIPDRIRKSVNVLLCLAAVVGIGWSGKEIWQVWNNRRQIEAGCAGLVPAGRVLALSPAGGGIRHRVGDEGTIELDAGLPQDCELFSTEAGEKLGTRTGERWFFTAAVGVHPDESPTVPEGPWGFLLDPLGKPDHPAEPLGGGITGTVTDSGVIVELPCAGGKAGDRPVKSLWARASLMDLRSAFRDNGQLTDHDRNVLAETAVLTANNLADRLGCADRLPDPPEDVPALTRGPLPVSRANGTCAWYREAGFARQDGLADQVFESRRKGETWDESCALVLSRGEANGLYRAHRDEKKYGYIVEPQNPGQWFVSFHTYSGELAKNVQLKDIHSDETPTVAAPGEAGRDGQGLAVWWASSVCGGKPRIHTMTIAVGYDKLTALAYEKVFRAYVTDAAERHDCTDITFPAHETFTAAYAEKAAS
ncbi:hypothetical protein [Streptomyces sp. NPDC012510]|uniref:hypothetical protein n=1 Tax=Streptomyces sp. NPDC012510 TaxID=3364838 RepID=UPI0036EF072E